MPKGSFTLPSCMLLQLPRWTVALQRFIVKQFIQFKVTGTNNLHTFNKWLVLEDVFPMVLQG